MIDFAAQSVCMMISALVMEFVLSPMTVNQHVIVMTISLDQDVQVNG